MTFFNILYLNPTCSPETDRTHQEESFDTHFFDCFRRNGLQFQKEAESDFNIHIIILFAL